MAEAHTPVVFTDSICRITHIEIYFHFIQDLVMEGKIDVKFTPSKEYIVDILIQPFEESKLSSKYIQI